LEARDSGVQKVVAINNEMEYYNLMHTLNITAVRGPKMSAYHKIIEEIGSTGVVLKKHFCGGKATVFMRKIFTNSQLIGKKIKPLKLNHSSLFYLKHNNLEIFSDKIVLEKNDLIISFCIEKESEKVQKWIYEL
jgi:trk system potassium uptake protein TrkA